MLHRAPQLKPVVRRSIGSAVMPLMKVILSTSLLLGAAELSYARQWRGLVPLRSTRSDVVRLLNQCSDQREACRFTLDKEDVHILFSGGLPREYGECGARLAPETIMFIEIEPRGKLKLRDLRLDKRTLQFFNPSAPFNRGLKGYRSSDGFVLSLFKDEILQIFYIADESDKHRCFAYYQQPESFVEMSIDHVEVIYAIDCPESIKAGEKLVVSAHSTMNETRGYKWELNAGRIIAGQYTQQITVDTTGLAGQKITITAEIGDVFGHYVAGSCVVQILANQSTFRARNASAAANRRLQLTASYATFPYVTRLGEYMSIQGPKTRASVFLPPGEGRSYPMGRISAIFKADGDETQNGYSISEWWLEPGTQGPGAHSHPEDDIFYVIEGTMSFLIGDHWINAIKGSFVLAPGGVTHDFENRSSSRAGVLNFSIPGDFEKNMPMIVEYFAANPPKDAERLSGLAGE